VACKSLYEFERIEQVLSFDAIKRLKSLSTSRGWCGSHHRMSTQSQNAAQILSRLQQRLAGSNTSEWWLILGDALAELEEVGSNSVDGRPWTEVVREVHEKLGYDGLNRPGFTGDFVVQ